MWDGVWSKEERRGKETSEDGDMLGSYTMYWTRNEGERDWISERLRKKRRGNEKK